VIMSGDCTGRASNTHCAHPILSEPLSDVSVSDVLKKWFSPGHQNRLITVYYLFDLHRSAHLSYLYSGFAVVYKCQVHLSSVIYLAWLLPCELCSALYMPWPCVCLSVTGRYYIKTATRRITQTTSHDSSWTLVFQAKNLFKIRTGSPPTGAPNAGGVGQSWRISTNNSLYLENETR